MTYIIPDKLYQVLKWLCALVLPAAATLVATVGPVWGMEADLCTAVTTTITALATFGGVVLGVSAVTAKVDPDA